MEQKFEKSNDKLGFWTLGQDRKVLWRVFALKQSDRYALYYVNHLRNPFYEKVMREIGTASDEKEVEKKLREYALSIQG